MQERRAKTHPYALSKDLFTAQIDLKNEKDKKKEGTITYLLYIMFYYKSCLVYCILYLCCGFVVCSSRMGPVAFRCLFLMPRT